MMQDQDDMQLVKAACAGDARAFETLIERHYDRIFRMAFQWCRNRSDAEDITQLVCIKLARVIGQYSGKAAFTTWLYRLVVNTAIDWQRQNRRSDTAALEEDMDLAGNDDAEARLIRADAFRQVLSLPEKEKTALLLVFGEGLTHADAALVMQVKESTVSWYIFEARKKLGVKTEKKERHHG